LLLAPVVAVFAVLLAFFFGSWAGESLDPPRPYHVVDIPGKGKGVIATRDITRGELLYRESPLFIVPNKSACSRIILIGLVAVNQGTLL
jgi:hypothetical protein